jgi:hypothetical protein
MEKEKEKDYWEGREEEGPYTALKKNNSRAEENKEED